MHLNPPVQRSIVVSSFVYKSTFEPSYHLLEECSIFTDLRMYNQAIYEHQTPHKEGMVARYSVGPIAGVLRDLKELYETP